MKKQLTVLSLFIVVSALNLSSAHAQVQVAVIVKPQIGHSDRGCGHQSSHYHKQRHCCEGHGHHVHHNHHDHGYSNHPGNGRGNGHKKGHHKGHDHH
jgi:hypothetical protein